MIGFSPMMLLYLSIIHGFPVAKFYQSAFTLYGAAQRSERPFFPPSARIQSAPHAKQLMLHRSSKTDFDFIMDDIIIDRLVYVTSVIVLELAEFIKGLPTPSDIVEMYKCHPNYDGDHEDCDYVGLLGSMYIHHIMKRPNQIMKLLPVLQKIRRSIDESADVIYDQFVQKHGSIVSSSSKGFSDIWHKKIESKLHNLESHLIFRLLILETLLNFWNSDINELPNQNIN